MSDVLFLLRLTWVLLGSWHPFHILRQVIQMATIVCSIGSFSLHSWHIFYKLYTQMSYSSITQLCPTLCDPMVWSMPGFPVHHRLPELAQTMSIESVMPSNHLVLCHPLLLLPSIFPSIRVFSNESVLFMRWPKYWSFRFSISLSNEYSGLISLS